MKSKNNKIKPGSIECKLIFEKKKLISNKKKKNNIQILNWKITKKKLNNLSCFKKNKNIKNF